MAAPEMCPKSVHSRFEWITLGTVVYTAGFLDLFAVSMVVPWIVKEGKAMELSPFLLGLLGSIYGAVQFFSSPIAGYMSDKFGRKPVLLFCLFLTSISYMILTFADRTVGTIPFPIVVGTLFVGRIVAGVFKHSQTLVRAILSESVPRSEKPAIFGRFNAFSNFGFIVGSALGGNIASGPRGFYRISLCASLLFLINFLINWVLLADIPDNPVDSKNSSSHDSPKSKKQKGEEAKKPSPVKLVDYYDLLLVQFFLALAALTYRSNFTLILEESFLLESHMIGYIMSFQGIISAGTGLLAGHAARCIGSPTRRMTLTSLLTSVSLVGVTFAPSATIAVACLVPFCIANALGRVASAEVTAARAPPGLMGSLVGLTQTFTASARTVAPLVASFSQDYSVFGPGTCGAIFAFLGYLLTYHLVPLPDITGLGSEGEAKTDYVEVNGLVADREAREKKRN